MPIVKYFEKHFAERKQNEAYVKGRVMKECTNLQAGERLGDYTIIRLLGKPMKEAAGEAAVGAYADHFVGALKILIEALKARGVGKIHVCYKGPVVLMTALGVIARNNIEVVVYHFISGFEYVKAINSKDIE